MLGVVYSRTVTGRCEATAASHVPGATGRRPAFQIHSGQISSTCTHVNYSIVVAHHTWVMCRSPRQSHVPTQNHVSGAKSHLASLNGTDDTPVADMTYFLAGDNFGVSTSPSLA